MKPIRLFISSVQKEFVGCVPRFGITCVAMR